MQISGFGAGFGQNKKNNPRTLQFRQNHRVGEMVKAIYLEAEANNLAWVKIDSQKLLAAVTRDYLPGQEMLFEIVKLHPEILLKELDPSQIKNKPRLNILV